MLDRHRPVTIERSTPDCEVEDVDKHVCRDAVPADHLDDQIQAVNLVPL